MHGRFSYSVSSIFVFSLPAHIVEDRRIPTNSSTGKNSNNNNINSSGKSNNNNNSNNNMSANVSVQYYARVFISVKGDLRSRFSRSSNNLNLNSTSSSSSSSSASASVGGTEGVGFADSEGRTKYYNVVTPLVLLRYSYKLHNVFNLFVAIEGIASLYFMLVSPPLLILFIFVALGLCLLLH